jgi:hypothetical protein
MQNNTQLSVVQSVGSPPETMPALFNTQPVFTPVASQASTVVVMLTASSELDASLESNDPALVRENAERDLWHQRRPGAGF